MGSGVKSLRSAHEKDYSGTSPCCAPRRNAPRCIHRYSRKYFSRLVQKWRYLVDHSRIELIHKWDAIDLQAQGGSNQGSDDPNQPSSPQPLPSDSRTRWALRRAEFLSSLLGKVTIVSAAAIIHALELDRNTTSIEVDGHGLGCMNSCSLSLDFFLFAPLSSPSISSPQ